MQFNSTPLLHQIQSQSELKAIKREQMAFALLNTLIAQQGPSSTAEVMVKYAVKYVDCFLEEIEKTKQQDL